LTPSDIRLLDAEGKRVPASVIFLRTYVHGLYPPSREPGRLPEQELRRTGRKAVIGPGESAPLTAAWRQRRGADPPVRVDYRAGSLRIPGV